ncbi:MAG: ComEC/Rec2 family competence protein [Actinomycetaceae bacterium]|nr:ComEC/Rec2 family competence protein [Actinomycetaceae bacterium]
MRVGGSKSGAKNRPPLDLRWLPAAALAWITAIFVLAWMMSKKPLEGLFLIVLAALFLALLLGAWMSNKRARHARYDVGSFRVAATLLALVIAVSGLSAALHGLAFANHPAREACSLHCTIRAEVQRGSRELDTGSWITWASIPGATMMLIGEKVDAEVGDSLVLEGRLVQGGTPPTLGTMKATRVEVHPAKGWRAKFRQNLSEALAGYERDQQGLIAGMSIGDFSAITPESRSAMIQTSTSHLTAISGMHLAIVIGTINALLPGRGRLKVVFVTALVGALVAIVGPTPSILRAVSMAAIPSWGQLVGRSGQVLNSLALVTLAWIITDPFLALSAGFTLSVFSTAGVLVVSAIYRAPKFSIRKPSLKTLASRLLVSAVIPLAATIAASPMLLHMNGSIATYAVPTNALLSPLILPTTLLALSTAVFAQFGLAQYPGVGAAWCADAITQVARYFASLPGSQISGHYALAVVLVLEVLAGLVVAWYLLPLLVDHRIKSKPLSSIQEVQR